MLRWRPRGTHGLAGAGAARLLGTGTGLTNGRSSSAQTTWRLLAQPVLTGSAVLIGKGDRAKDGVTFLPGI